MSANSFSESMSGALTIWKPESVPNRQVSREKLTKQTPASAEVIISFSFFRFKWQLCCKGASIAHCPIRRWNGLELANDVEKVIDDAVCVRACVRALRSVWRCCAATASKTSRGGTTAIALFTT